MKKEKNKVLYTHKIKGGNFIHFIRFKSRVKLNIDETIDFFNRIIIFLRNNREQQDLSRLFFKEFVSESAELQLLNKTYNLSPINRINTHIKNIGLILYYFDYYNYFCLKKTKTLF